jgi:serine/threonine protein phosphatase PrpC
MVSEFDKEVLVSQITEDHKPELTNETARILANGGKVAKKNNLGPYRIWNKKMTAPGLAMSRSLGDVYAHKLGCSSEGEIFTQTLLPHDKIIILGSDGIF